MLNGPVKNKSPREYCAKIRNGLRKIISFIRLMVQSFSGPKYVGYFTIRESRKALLDFSFYILFLVVASIVTQLNRHPFMYCYNRLMYGALANFKKVIEPGMELTFKSVDSIPKYWDFLNYTFLPFLQYGDYRPNDPAAIYKEGQGHDSIYVNVENRTVLHGNILIGPPRLRQIRVSEGSCDYNPTFSPYMKTCYPDYSVFEEDRGKYHGVEFLSIWQSDIMPIWTDIEIYMGAGFIVDFSYDAAKNYALLKELTDKEWIDPATRIVILEFNFYHPDTHLFQMSKFFLELPSTGGCLPSVEFYAATMETFFTRESWSLNVAIVIYYFLITVISVRELLLARKMRLSKYLKRAINVIDFLYCFLSYVLIIMNCEHWFYMKYLNRALKSRDTYTNMDRRTTWVITYNNIAAFTIFLIWIRILHFLRFNRTMFVLGNVLTKSANEAFGYLLLFSIILMAYAQCGMILFGCTDAQFSNLYTALLSMVRWIITDFVYEDMHKSNHILTSLYYITFVVFVYGILFYSFLGVINCVYDEVNSELKIYPSKLGITLKLIFIEIYDKLYAIVTGKRKERPYVDIYRRGDLDSEGRIDPRQAAALAAARLQAKIHPPAIEQAEYLPARMDRAAERVKALKEITVPALRGSLRYFNRLRRERNLPELDVDFEMPNDPFY